MGAGSTDTSQQVAKIDSAKLELMKQTDKDVSKLQEKQRNLSDKAYQAFEQVGWTQRDMGRDLVSDETATNQNLTTFSNQLEGSRRGINEGYRSRRQSARDRGLLSGYKSKPVNLEDMKSFFSGMK